MTTWWHVSRRVYQLRRRKVTKIEWTDETWNPWVGCDKVAPGLPGNLKDGDYAATFASREPERTSHDQD
jgi:protein gp37